MEYKISSGFAVHDGSTKFYAVYAIEARGREMVVHHYGPYREGNDHRPGSVGQVKVMMTLNAANEADRKIREKSKRGYRNWIKDSYTLDEETFGLKMIEIFGATDGVTYMRQLEIPPERMHAGVAKKPAPVFESSIGNEWWGQW